MPNPTFQVHRILPDHITEMRKYRLIKERQLGHKIAPIPGDFQARWVHHVLKKRYPIKILTIVREPIGRELSAWFQNFETTFNISHDRWDGDVKTLNEKLVSQVKRMTNEQRSETIYWFEEIFKPTLGVDIFDYPFPKDHGFMRIRQQNIDLLVMRLEMPDAEKETIIGDFLNCPAFKLMNANIGSEKDYAATYKQVRDTIVFPQEYLDMVYNSRFMRHFYTDAEITRFRARWER